MAGTCIFAGMLIPIKLRNRWPLMLSGDEESDNEEVLEGEVVTIFLRGHMFCH